jgi:hypothetical protein
MSSGRITTKHTKYTKHGTGMHTDWRFHGLVYFAYFVVTQAFLR